MFTAATKTIVNDVYEERIDAGQAIEPERVMPRMCAAVCAASTQGYGLNLLFLLIGRQFVHGSGK
jgi:hypothetical protein